MFTADHFVSFFYDNMPTFCVGAFEHADGPHEISRSMPQYHVGHLARVAQIDRHLRPHFGLQLAGGYFRGVGIPQCIYSGTRAAERVMTTV